MQEMPEDSESAPHAAFVAHSAQLSSGVPPLPSDHVLVSVLHQYGGGDGAAGCNGGGGEGSGELVVTM